MNPARHRAGVKLPAIRQLLQSARVTAMRFPLVLLAAALATVCAILAVHSSHEDDLEMRLIMCATLGLPLLLCLTVSGERRAKSAIGRAALLAAGVAILTGFGIAWGGWSSTIRMTRYAQLSAGFHLLVAFLPFAGLAEENGFWQYNKALFIRFLTAALYSAVLFAGLSIALLAIDHLLGIKVAEETYARLWFVISFLFNTWVFLAGVPDDLSELNQHTDYPGGLRVFSQFVLVPIVAIYLLILTVYLGKVIATRTWPSGWIGYLVSSVAATGILSWLLIRPLEDREGYTWVRVYTRGFFIAMMPAIVMVWLAIWKRVQQYGITERRYFMVVLSLWLGAIAIYYARRGSRSIRVIPASLAAVALLSYAGPWGAYSVSQSSQVRRLERLLSRNGLLVNGRARAAARPVSSEDRKEIGGILDYLGRVHGWGSTSRLLSDSILPPPVGKPGFAIGAYPSETQRIMGRLGMEYLGSAGLGRGRYVSYYVSVREALPVANFEYAIPITGQLIRDSMRLGDGTIVSIAGDSSVLRLRRGGQSLLELPLQAIADSAAAFQARPDSTGRAPRGPIPQRVLHGGAEQGPVKAELYLNSLMGWLSEGTMKVTSLEGQLFVRF
jgi:hypothetical protein